MSAAPEESDAGLQSVGDLMAGLLLLFMLLAMVFALSLSRTEQSREVEIEALTQAADDQAVLRSDVEQRLEAVGVPVTVTAEPGVLRLGEGAIRFAAGRHDTEEAATLQALDHLAAALVDTLPAYACSASSGRCPQPPIAALESVLIEGHSDTVDRLDDCDNHCLSAERAAWTREQLLQRAPELADLRNRSGHSLFGVSGYGPDRSLTGHDAETCAAQPELCREDRRIEVRLRMEAQTHLLPGPP